MGANAQTSVPTFTAGEVLTAANMNISARTGIPVFADSTARDAAFGGTGEKTLAEGQFAYLESTNATQYYDGAAWQAVATAPGLVLVATATPTAVASVSINNCFTSTYENYRIVFTATAVTVAGDLTMRLRASGTDTSANYVYQTLESYSATTASTLNVVGTDEWYISRIDTPVGTSSSTDVYRPQLAQKTAYTSSAVFQSATPTLIQQQASGLQTGTTQFDGFTLLFGGTNFTGTVRVYGYANS